MLSASFDLVVLPRDQELCLAVQCRAAEASDMDESRDHVCLRYSIHLCDNIATLIAQSLLILQTWTEADRVS